jgi:ElaB/YqjD/DUF883 family membrane-anchored ribosome-binding protein
MDSNNSTAAATADSGAPPIVEQAKRQAQQMVEKTQQKAGEAMDQATTEIHTRLDNSKSAAATTLTDVAQVVRTGTDHIRQQPQPVASTIAEYAQSAADAVEQVAGYIRDTSTEQIVHETELFARRQPLVFLGSAFAVGFLAARFLKSDNPNGQNGQNRQNNWSSSGASDRMLPVPQTEGAASGWEERSRNDAAPAGV